LNQVFRLFSVSLSKPKNGFLSANFGLNGPGNRFAGLFFNKIPDDYRPKIFHVFGAIVLLATNLKPPPL
jgi:hypothetical protein